MSTSVETFTDSDGLVAAAGERLIDVDRGCRLPRAGGP